MAAPESYVPVCASVICEAPGVIYVSIDPDVWKIRCRQCQEKAEHKCALKKLKHKFRRDPSKRKQLKGSIDEQKEGENELNSGEGGSKNGGSGGKGNGGKGNGGKGGKEGKEGKGEKGDEEGEDEKKKGRKKGQKGKNAGSEFGKDRQDPDNLWLNPPGQLPDDVCACPDRPKNAPPKPNLCLCEIYKPTNFMLELQVSGEFKPAYVPKTKKGKE